MHTNSSQRKRILIYGINFSPEPVGIGKYTGELARWLSEHNFEVRVVTAPSYFPEWRASRNLYRCEREHGISVIRCPLWVPRKPSGLTRLIHLASFAISSMPVVLWQVRWQPDVIFTVAPAFFCAPASLFLKHLCFRRHQPTKAYLHIQDFELDAAFELGILKGARIRNIAEAWERSILKGFDVVSTISGAMRHLAIRKGVSEDRAILLPNWVQTNKIYPQDKEQRTLNPYRKELNIKPGQVVILYSGSMNKKQGLDTIAEAIEQLQCHEELAWIIAGEGPSKEEFTMKVRNYSNVRILPLQPDERMNDWLNLGDIHLLPQKKGAADLVLPSKLLGIMACGRPVVASSPENTELGNLATLAGIRIDPENSKQLVKAIKKLVKDRELCEELGRTARNIVEENFDQDYILGKLANALMSGECDDGAVDL